MEFSTTVNYTPRVTTTYTTTGNSILSYDNREYWNELYAKMDEMKDTASKPNPIDVGGMTEAEEDRIVEKLTAKLRKIANDEHESDEVFKDYLKEVLGV